MAHHQQQNDGNYKTADLYFSAYLKAAAVEFLHTEPDPKDPKRTNFVFVRPENIRDLKAQYFTRRAKVSALTYADEIKALKTLTHMERD